MIYVKSISKMLEGVDVNVMLDRSSSTKLSLHINAMSMTKG